MVPLGPSPPPPRRCRIGAAAATAFPQERREVASTSGVFSADFRTIDFRAFFVRFCVFSDVFGRFYREKEESTLGENYYEAPLFIEKWKKQFIKKPEY